MATCYICDKPDGWNHTMLNHKGQTVPICITCFRIGCARCNHLFDREAHKPVEVRMMDHDGPGDDSQVWCKKCADKGEALSEVYCNDPENWK